MASLVERQALLAELHTLGVADLLVLWRAAQNTDDVWSFIVEAFPELVAQYGVTAAELSALWYDEQAPDLAYVAAPAALPPLEKFAESAKWALGSGSGAMSFEKLSGVLQRGVYDMARQTTIENAAAEGGARWARHASANACEFCRMVATRGAVYTSESAATRVGGRGKAVSSNYDPVTGKRKRGGQAKGVRARGSQKVGSRYHDNCRCMAVEVRPGRSYEPPPYVEKWEQEYIAASREVSRGAGAGDTKDILAAMRRNAK